MIQKRGVKIIDENFNEITKTYPRCEAFSPIHNSKSELERARKEQIKENAKRYDSRLDYEFRVNVPIEELVDYETYNPSPRYTSLSSKIEQERSLAREKAGLSPQPLQKPDLSLDYIESPTLKTYTELKDNRKKNFIKDMNESVDFAHKPEHIRLYIREEARVPPDCDNNTYAKVRRRQISADMQHNINNFGVQVIGVHGANYPSSEITSLTTGRKIEGCLLYTSPSPRDS